MRAPEWPRPARVDFLLTVPGATFATAWKRRLIIEIAGTKVNVIGRDDLLANKRAVARPQIAEGAALGYALDERCRKAEIAAANASKCAMPEGSSVHRRSASRDP